MRVLIAALGCITLVASPAQARWRKAESEHFVIYANDSARDLERFGDMLERFHRALELATQRTMPRPSPSNRVTIYAVGDETAMRRLAGSNEIAGFYSPGAGSSVAFVQDARPTSGEPQFSLVVLLHEYAHHFAISTSHFSDPPWMTEGSAEFFASARFPRDGGVEIGRAAQHRAGELFYAKEVPIRELLDADLYEQARSDEYDAFYGRAWLLYHYLNLSGQRPGQLGQYVRSLAEGQGALEAAETAFGDLDTLESDLDSYLNQRRISMVTVSPELTQHGPVTVSELSDGMVEVLPLQIRSKRGVSSEEALELLPRVRAIAARFPEDAGVLAELAEAELDAGNDAEAIAAADRAIAADPATVNAYIQKGIALFRIAASAEPDARPAAIDAAMEPFSALNRIENDHPLPLIYFYRTFRERGEQPTELARRALERASELAPFDRSLTMEVAIMMAEAGEIEQARLFARVLANDPHGGQLGDFAAAFLTSLETAKVGEPFHLDPPVIDENASNDVTK